MVSEIAANLLRKVLAPNGYGILAGKKLVNEQVRVLVRHDRRDPLVVSEALELSTFEGDPNWVFYTYPPEMVEVVDLPPNPLPEGMGS